MTDAWQEAWVEVLPDFSQFTKTADKEMTSVLGSAGDKGGKRAGAGVSAGIIGGITGALALGAVSIAGDIGRLIGDSIGSAINFALDGIDLASDLAESTNAIKVSFGEAADGISALGEDAATRLALTQNQFNGIATQFAGFAKTIVGDGGDVVGLIDQLTTRGSDFASVYNLDVSEALGLFQSGLAGETEPLRKFSIDLSAAAVEAYAYANGIGVVGSELSEAQKVQARYGLLLQSTNQVAGDFANTSGGLAGQQRILAASYAQAQTQLGTALLPTMTEFVTLANDQLIPALNDVVAEIGPELASSLQESMPAFKELLVAIVPLIPELVKLAVSVLPPLLQLLIALSPLLIDWAANTTGVLEAAQFLYAFFAGETTLEETAAKLGALGGSFAEFSRFLATALTNAGRGFEFFSAQVNTNIGAAIGFITTLPGQITGALSGVPNLLVQAGKDLMNGFIAGIQSMATKLAESALKSVKDAVKGVKDFLGIKSPSKLYEQFGIYTAEGYIKGVDGKTAAVASSLQSMVAPPTISAYGASASGVPSAATASPIGGAFVNYGTIITQDVSELADEVEKKKRRAYATLQGLKVA